MAVIPPMNLTKEATPWGKALQAEVESLNSQYRILANAHAGTASQQTSTASALTATTATAAGVQQEVTDDKRVPQAPTGLVASSTGVFGVDGRPASTVDASWAPVTLDVNGANITVVQYEIWWKPTAAADSEYIPLSATAENTFSVASFVPDQQFTVKVRAHSAAGVFGDFGEPEGVVGGAPAAQLDPPTAPTLTQDLGVVKAAWDGLLTTGTPSARIAYAYSSASMTQTGVYVPVAQRLDFAGAEATIVGWPTDAYCWVQFIAVDRAGKESAPSAAASILVKGVDLGDLDASVAAAVAAAEQAGVDGQAAAALAATAASTADGKAVAAQTAATNASSAASVADGKAVTAKSAADAAAAAASAADGKATTAQTAADAAATAAATADDNAAAAAGIANGKAVVLYQTTAPSAAYQNALTLWIDTTGGANTPKKWVSGTTWVAVTDKAATDAAAAAVAAQGTANTAKTDAATAQTAANSAQGTANTALSTANGKNKTIFSTSAASGTTGYVSGDIWFQKAGTVIVGQWEFVAGAWAARTIDNAVIANLDAGKITVGTLNAARIAAGTITGTHLATGTVTASDIAANTITASQIAAGAITASELAANSVVAANIAAGAVTSGKVAANSITSTEMLAGTITAASGIIADAAITDAKIADATISSAKIATLDAGKITAGTLDAARIAAGTITGSHLAANTITAADIAADTITGAQIAAGTVTASEMAANSVVAASIAAGQVTAGKLATNSVVAANIAAGQVQATHLAANSVTAGSISATAIDGKTITGAVVRTAASGARVELNSTGLNGYNSSGTAVTKVGTDGILTATGATVTGTINATGGTFSGAVAVTGTLTGGTVQTAASGQRVWLKGTEVRFFSPNGQSGTITAVDNGASGGLVTIDGGLGGIRVGHQNLAGGNAVEAAADDGFLTDRIYADQIMNPAGGASAPYAMAVGNANVPVNGTATLFPSGRFTVTPIVMYSALQYDGSPAVVRELAAVDKNGFTVRLENFSGGLVGGYVRWTATQMTPTSAAG